MSLNRLGAVMLEVNDLAGALAADQESLTIARQVATVDVGNSRARRDVSVSLTNLGDAKLRTGDHASALSAYQESLAIRRALANLDPGNAEAQTDLVVSLYKHSKANDAPDSRLREALDILDTLDKQGRLPPDKKGWRSIVTSALRFPWQ